MLIALLLACTPDAPVETSNTLALATRLADKGIDEWDADHLAPDWIQTVWAYGVLRLGVATGDDRYRHYPTDWIRSHSGDVGPFVSSDSLSPSLVAASLFADDPTLDFQNILTEADRYLDAAPRAQNGAIEHWSDAAPFGVPDQVWVDSQFMFGMYLLERFRGTGDRAYLDRFVEQYVAFSDLLRDPDDALYRHAWDDAQGVNIPSDAVYWARGNSWVLISGVELLALVPANDPAAITVRPLWQAHARAVADAQANDGLWHTVMNEPNGDDPTNYTETSGSALLATALARGVRLGELDDSYVPVVARAVDGVQARVVDDVVYGTSYGTVPGDYAYYVGVEQGSDLMLGVGSVVLLLAEADGLPTEVAP